jgi:hypothetical protein
MLTAKMEYNDTKKKSFTKNNTGKAFTLRSQTSVFTYFLYGPGQMPIRAMLNFNRLCVSAPLYFP